MTRTATQRAKDATARRQAAGCRVIRVILSPAATRALERLTGASGVTITSAVVDSLIAASPEPAPAIDEAPADWLTRARSVLE
jgi:hypothetical protein